MLEPLAGLADWEVTVRLSNALGYPMNYTHPSEIMDEIAEQLTQIDAQLAVIDGQLGVVADAAARPDLGARPQARVQRSPLIMNVAVPSGPG